MPRIARLVIPEVPHHITQRGNYQQNIFFGDSDRVKYLSLVAEYVKMQKVEVLAYCLMNNHIHFAVVPYQSDSLGIMFNQISMRYSQYFNKKLGKRGHLWQDRYYSCPLDNDHLYEVLRYIENNPVKAGIVKSAEKYRWSSAKAHIHNNIEDDDILSDHSKYLKEIDNWNEYLCEDSNDEKISNIIKCTSNGRPAGNKQFIKELEFKTSRNLRSKPMGRPKNDN